MSHKHSPSKQPFPLAFPEPTTNANPSVHVNPIPDGPPPSYASSQIPTAYGFNVPQHPQLFHGVEPGPQVYMHGLSLRQCPPPYLGPDAPEYMVVIGVKQPKRDKKNKRLKRAVKFGIPIFAVSPGVYAIRKLPDSSSSDSD